MKLQEFDKERAEFLYHQPSDWEKNGQIWTVRGGCSIGKSGYQVSPRRLDCYSFHYIKEGRLLYESDLHEQIVRGGDLYCLFPNRTYSYRRMDDIEPMQMYWLAFDGPQAAHLLHEAGFSPESPHSAKRWSNGLQARLEQIFHLMREHASPSILLGMQMQSALLQFFSALFREDKSDGVPRHQQWIESSMQYMELHATEGLTVAQLADMAGMNRNYFSTAFAQHTGMPPLLYMTGIRVKKAQKLLHETNDSITEIAYSLGYANLYVFSRAFHRYCGLSPTEYRATKKLISHDWSR
ncbi:AraC family transcriptional regulator [Paenibacillus sp. HB172176]|uniref:helix-turn-helix domain-containing protein n=1 Tax=Paenibacillus sp. HB172176 TaxID=2493690 RepID=UPI00143C7AD4|nr:AraC family transcriptional regulator [Paenibacillus sp. HB172176]